MSAQQTHRSRAQTRAQAKVQAKRARNELLEEPNTDVPLGRDNGRFFYSDKERCDTQ